MIDPTTGKESANQAAVDQDVIELLVDKWGLDGVLSMLASVCRDKADHLRTNWQDSQGAGWWDRDAVKLDRVARTVTN